MWAWFGGHPKSPLHPSVALGSRERSRAGGEPKRVPRLPRWGLGREDSSGVRPLGWWGAVWEPGRGGELAGEGTSRVVREGDLCGWWCHERRSMAGSSLVLVQPEAGAGKKDAFHEVEVGALMRMHRAVTLRPQLI